MAQAIGSSLYEEVMIGPAPALGNAIRRAVGSRPYQTPFSRDRVWRRARDASSQVDPPNVTTSPVVWPRSAESPT